jgi:hypothetical protein
MSEMHRDPIRAEAPPSQDAGPEIRSTPVAKRNAILTGELSELEVLDFVARVKRSNPALKRPVTTQTWQPPKQVLWIFG